MIADGIFISKLIYLMPAWVGCEEYLVDVLQVCQNKAARLVTKLDRFTPTRVLLRQCGWLSVKQLMVYHSLVLLRKVFQNQKPEYLYQKITAGAPQRNTRQSLAVARTLAAAGVLSQPTSPSCDLSLTRSSWCWSAVHWHNQIPPSLRSEKNEKTFKTKLKSWVSENVENLLEVD